MAQLELSRFSIDNFPEAVAALQAAVNFLGEHARIVGLEQLLKSELAERQATIDAAEKVIGVEAAASLLRDDDRSAVHVARAENARTERDQAAEASARIRLALAALPAMLCAHEAKVRALIADLEAATSPMRTGMRAAADSTYQSILDDLSKFLITVHALVAVGVMRSDFPSEVQMPNINRPGSLVLDGARLRTGPDTVRDLKREWPADPIAAKLYAMAAPFHEARNRLRAIAHAIEIRRDRQRDIDNARAHARGGQTKPPAITVDESVATLEKAMAEDAARRPKTYLNSFKAGPGAI